MEDIELSVVETVRSENLFSTLVTLSDSALDAAVLPDAFSGIPVISVLIGLWKAQREISHNLYVRKIMRFLKGLADTTQEERTKFTEQLEKEGATKAFGETILLILDKIDDIAKPEIIGRIMAAHIKGHIEYSKAMRMAYMINRCYTNDLEHLRNFRDGTQGKMTGVADALFSCGLLSSQGIDGGDISDPESGGTIYTMNEYGKLVVEFGLR